MPGALGPRFALEAGFLILLAVVLALADLSPLLIILIMAVAWVLVSLIEYFAWRQAPRYPARYAAAGAPSMLDEEQVVIEEPAPVPPPPVHAPPAADEATMVEPRPATVVESRADDTGEVEPPAAALPEAGSAEETSDQADARVDAARLAFSEQERQSRTRHRLEPLQPRPRRRWGVFGPRTRPGESPSEEEQ